MSLAVNPDRGAQGEEKEGSRGANDGASVLPSPTLEQVLRALPDLPDRAENEALAEELSDFEALLAADPEFSEHCDRERDAWIESMEKALEHTAANGGSAGETTTEFDTEMLGAKGSDHERA